MLPNTASLEPARIGARNSLVARFAARRGGLAEADLAALARETCEHRPRECIAWLARWKHVAPVSGERRALLRELDGRPELRRERAQLGALARLYSSTPLGGDPWVSLDDSVAAFALYSLHAAPFPRAVLEEAWSRCQEAPAYRERCEASRAGWEALLGSFTRQGPSDGDRDGERPGS